MKREFVYGIVFLFVILAVGISYTGTLNQPESLFSPEESDIGLSCGESYTDVVTGEYTLRSGAVYTVYRNWPDYGNCNARYNDWKEDNPEQHQSNVQKTIDKALEDCRAKKASLLERIFCAISECSPLEEEGDDCKLIGSGEINCAGSNLGGERNFWGNIYCEEVCYARAYAKIEASCPLGSSGSAGGAQVEKGIGV